MIFHKGGTSIYFLNAVLSLNAQVVNKEILLEDLGLRDYKETWDYQEQLFQGILDIKSNNRRTGQQKVTPNYFLFVEHPHVFTLGKSGDRSNLLISEEHLAQKNARFYKIN